MPPCPLTAYDSTHAMVNGINAFAPNNSIPIITQAIGALAAALNVATMPTDANKGTDAPSTVATCAPASAPIMKSGSSLSQASYKPLLDNLYDASPLNGSN